MANVSCSPKLNVCLLPAVITLCCTAVLADWEVTSLTRRITVLSTDSQGRVYACKPDQDGYLYVSSDNGQNWEERTLPVPDGRHVPRKVTLTGDELYAHDHGAGLGLFRSSDQGVSWEEVLPDVCLTSVLKNGACLLIASCLTSEGVKAGSSGDFVSVFDQVCRDMLSDNTGNVYLLSDDEVFRSDQPDGSGESRLCAVPYEHYSEFLIASNGRLYTWSWLFGLSRSTSDFTEWDELLNRDDDNVVVTDVAQISLDEFLYADGDTSDANYPVRRSTDGGDTWSGYWEGLPPRAAVSNLAVSKDYLFAAVYETSGEYRIYRRNRSDSPSVARDLRATPPSAVAASNHAGSMAVYRLDGTRAADINSVAKGACGVVVHALEDGTGVVRTLHR